MKMTLTAKSDLDDLTPADLAALDERINQIESTQQWRCDDQDCDGLPHAGREHRHARGKQVPPFLRPAAAQPTFVTGKWGRRELRYYKRWYARAGRRWGKTWAASHALAELIALYGGVDANGTQRVWFVVGTKWDYTIETLMESSSGLISALGGFDGPMLGSRLAAWNKSKGILTCLNGAKVRVSSAHDGGVHLQGEGYSGGWMDEPGLWNRKTWKTTWEDSILTSTAVAPGFIIVSGTPKKGHPLTAHLIADEQTCKVRGSMEENTSLSEDYRRERREQLAGSQRGLQELDGEQLDDVEGAVFTSMVIEDNRVTRSPVTTLDGYEKRRVVWDPAGTLEGDEHGITVWGALTHVDGFQHDYLLEDKSFNATPQQAGERVAELAVRYDAIVVIETNYGAQAFPTILARINPALVVHQVKAPPGYSKTRRAEDALALYETGRVHHVGEFPVLEQQMTTWTPESSDSPDRMDTVAWALRDLHPIEPQHTTGGVYVFDD